MGKDLSESITTESHLSAADFPLRTQHDIRAFTSYVDDLIHSATNDECPEEELDFFTTLILDSKKHAVIVWQTYDTLRERGRKLSRQVQQICWALESER